MTVKSGSLLQPVMLGVLSGLLCAAAGSADSRWVSLYPPVSWASPFLRLHCRQLPSLGGRPPALCVCVLRGRPFGQAAGGKYWTRPAAR